MNSKKRNFDLLSKQQNIEHQIESSRRKKINGQEKFNGRNYEKRTLHYNKRLNSEENGIHLIFRNAGRRPLTKTWERCVSQNEGIKLEKLFQHAVKNHWESEKITINVISKKMVFPPQKSRL